MGRDRPRQEQEPLCQPREPHCWAVQLTGWGTKGSVRLPPLLRLPTSGGPPASPTLHEARPSPGPNGCFPGSLQPVGLGQELAPPFPHWGPAQDTEPSSPTTSSLSRQQRLTHNQRQRRRLGPRHGAPHLTPRPRKPCPTLLQGHPGTRRSHPSDRTKRPRTAFSRKGPLWPAAWSADEGLRPPCSRPRTPSRGNSTSPAPVAGDTREPPHAPSGLTRMNPKRDTALRTTGGTLSANAKSQ